MWVKQSPSKPAKTLGQRSLKALKLGSVSSLGFMVAASELRRVEMIWAAFAVMRNIEKETKHYKMR